MRSVVALDKLAHSEEQSLRKIEPISEGTILLPNNSMVDLMAADKFRVVRAHFERMLLGKPEKKIFAVTSAVPSEGKSLVSVNLSRAIASSINARVLLIDCDLRRPTVHKFFNISQEDGVSDAIACGHHLYQYIREVENNLHVISAGSISADPVSIIDHPSFKQAILQLSERYTHVILDCPPALLCPEPISLSNLADGTMLVVRAGHTDKTLVQDAVETIGKDKILGAILNDAHDSSSGYEYYGYYGIYAKKHSTKKGKKATGESFGKVLTQNASKVKKIGSYLRR